MKGKDYERIRIRQSPSKSLFCINTRIETLVSSRLFWNISLFLQVTGDKKTEVTYNSFDVYQGTVDPELFVAEQCLSKSTAGRAHISLSIVG